MSATKAKHRSLIVPALDPSVAGRKQVLIKFCGTTMRLGIRPTFTVVIEGALIGRTMTPHGEMIQIYNPTWHRWETYPVAQFESSFDFTVPPVIGMGDFAIVADVFHAPSGQEYGREYRRAQVQVLLRMFKDTH